MNNAFCLLASIFVVVSLGFYLRYMTRIKNKLYGDDSWGLLLWADYLRQGAKIQDFYRNFITRPVFDYPLAVSKFLSIFSKRCCEKIDPLFSPLVDSVNIAVIFVLSWLLTKNILTAFVASLIYSFTPSIVFNCVQLTARVAGYFLFLLTAVFTAYYIEFGNYPALIGVVLFGAILVNTHKMATQVFIFWLIGLAFLQKSAVLLLIPFLSLAVGIIISGGYYIRVLKGHARNLRMHLFAIYSKDTSAYPTESLKSASAKACFWGAIALWVYSENYPFSGYNRFAWNWFLVTYVLFILITFIKPLRCLGQGYRYLEYGVAPLAFLISGTILKDTEYPLFNIGVLAVILIIFSAHIHKQNKMFYGYYSNIVDEARLHIYEFFRGQKDRKILCLPSGLSMATAYFTRQIILWMPGTEWKKLEWLFPCITVPSKISLTEIIRRYDIDYLLLHADFAKPHDLGLVSPSIVRQEGDYFLIEARE